jgi:hypothetical protein
MSSIPPEKIQQYIIEYYNKQAKPLGKKAERYLKDYLTELQTALEYYRKLGKLLEHGSFSAALGPGTHRFSLLYNERLEDAVDNYYQQMSRLSSKTNHRFDTDYKNLIRVQKEEKQEKTADGREDRQIEEEAIRWLNENDKDVRTATESLHQSIVKAIQDQMKVVERLLERTGSAPFLLMLTRYNKGQASWMVAANKFRFEILAPLFERVDELHEEAHKRFEKAKLRLEIQRGLPQEQFGKEAMTAPKQLNYNGRVYHLVEAAETNPKFEGFPEIPMGKTLSADELKHKANEIRNIGMRLRQVSAGEGTGEVAQALHSLKKQMNSLVSAYEILAEFGEFFPKKMRLLGNPQRAMGAYEEIMAKLGAMEEAAELWGKNMGKWARQIDERARKLQSEQTRRPEPTDDPSKMKAPPQTVRF